MGSGEPVGVIAEEGLPLRMKGGVLRSWGGHFSVFSDGKADGSSGPFFGQIGGKPLGKRFGGGFGEEILDGLIKGEVFVLDEKTDGSGEVFGFRLVEICGAFFEDDLLFFRASQGEPAKNGARKEDGEEKNPNAFFH